MKIKFIIKFYLALIATLLCSCNESSQNFNSSSVMKNFTLEHYSQLNNSQIRINSPKATIKQNLNVILLDKSLVEITNKYDYKYIINADSSIFDNKNNFYSGDGNITLNSHANKSNYISSDSIRWNLNEDFIELNENVNLKNSLIDLKSIKAVYNTIENEAIFTGINNYTVLSNGKTTNRFLINVKADNAIWLGDSNTTSFYSDNNKQVITNIIIFSNQ